MSMATLGQPGTGPVAERIAAELVRAGLVSEQDRAAASQVVADGIRATRVVLPEPPGEHAPLRRRLSEVGGYVGAALVLGAGALLLAGQWSGLSQPARVGILAAIAVLLAAVGVGLVVRLPVARREGEHSAPGRLAGVLFAGAAVAAAAAVAVAVGSGPGDGAGALVGVGATLLVLGLAGYLTVPGAIGQAVAAAGAVWLVPSALIFATGDSNAIAAGLLLLGIGVVWLVLGERRVWRPQPVARLIGCTVAFAGAQVPLADSSYSWIAYVLTALIAAAAFATYVVRRAWPYLVLGVLATTVAVPEALTDWTGGSLGAAGVLLVAGVALLGASLAGLRLRKEVTGQEPSQHRVP